MVIKLSSPESHSLLEVSRKELVTKSRVQDKQRFSRRFNYQVSNFRGCDLRQLFENDMFVFTTPIKDYACTIAFPGVFTALKEVVKSTRGRIDRINLQMVIKALSMAFDATDDVKVSCDCGDWRYRFAYWATQNGYNYGPPENRPSDQTNPDDSLGATCKHLSLLLSNKRWLTKAASVINSFIKTYPDKAYLYLYDTYPGLPDSHEEVPDDDIDQVDIDTPESEDEIDIEPDESEVSRDEIEDEESEDENDESQDDDNEDRR